jgi:Protein of unknown function (DUF3500)
VVDGELAAATPCFTGADPAVSPLLRGTLNRLLARVEDLARELARSLSPDLDRHQQGSASPTGRRAGRPRRRPGQPGSGHRP